MQKRQHDLQQVYSTYCFNEKCKEGMKMENYIGNGIIRTARVTLVKCGYGDLSLTDKALFWNKSATSYLAFGLMAEATDNHVLIPLESISNISTYTYFPGGGITLLLKDGKQYKIAFKKKKDLDFFYEYLSKIDFSTVRGI